MLPLCLETQKLMLVRARRLELLPSVCYCSCLLYNASCVYYPSDVHSVPNLHVCNS
jgi:hypothetical protein